MSDWFGGNIDAEAHEEAIGLGPYGKALSILTFEELPDANAADEEEDLIVDSAISALDLPQSDYDLAELSSAVSRFSSLERE